MKICLNINSNIIKYLESSNEGGYESSISLIKELSKRRHEVNLVYPSDYYIKNSKPYVRKILKFKENSGRIFNHSSTGICQMKENNLEVIAKNSIPEGDLFLIGSLYGFHEERNIRIHKWTFLNMLKKYFTKMINNPEAEAKTGKHRFLELKDIPIIPSYIFSSKKELKEALNEKKFLVAKPIYKMQGRGVALMNKDNFFFNNKYLYQDLLSLSLEKRFVFLDKKIIASRIMTRFCKPWVKRQVILDPIEKFSPMKEEREIVNKIISQTALEFGCVDLLGAYVMGINGGGTSLFETNDLDNNRIYNVTDQVIKYLEIFLIIF